MNANTPFGRAGGLQATIAPGIAATESLAWTPQFEYGYYQWANKTGTLTSADTLTWVAASPSGQLDFGFDNQSAAVDGDLYFFNALPGARLNTTFVQSQSLDLEFAAVQKIDLFGKQIADFNGSTAFNLFKDGKGFDSIGNEWYNRRYFTVKASHFGETLEFTTGRYVIEGDIFPGLQDRFGFTLGTFDPISDCPGILIPGPELIDQPPLEKVCVDGRCYELDDPDLPITSLTASVPDRTLGQ